jgi:hypothetical protein
VVVTHCPVCRTKLDRSDQFFPPAVVLRCRPCKRFCVEGVADSWVDGGPDAMAQLRELATPIMIRDSDGDDPRWGA